jgi:plastocyanin
MKLWARATRLQVAVLGAGLLSAAALGAAAQPAGKTVTVHINGATYGALPTGLKVGDTIHWVNDDTVAHTVTAKDHSFDLHLNPGQSANQVMQKDGTFQIYCIYHSTMRGQLQAAAR